MTTLPPREHYTVERIYRAYELDADNNHRPHLGASLIGHACERSLWYTFHWCTQRSFEGRMLRLFETGQQEEARIVRNLRRIGVEVHETSPDGQQWRVSDIGGHFGGSMDAAAKGFPEAPKTWAVVEFKTHNVKSFTALKKDGVQKSKPLHYAQMQTYMGLTGMERAMYLAVCKDTDEMYGEWVHFDVAEFTRLRVKAERIITANEPPQRLSNDPSWYECKFCDHHAICHGERAPLHNCRTCLHSTAELDGDGRWTCQELGQDISTETQRASSNCKMHRYIPILLEKAGTQTDASDGNVIYTNPEGDTFANGEDGAALLSEELHAMEHLSMAATVAHVKQCALNQGIDSKVVG